MRESTTDQYIEAHDYAWTVFLQRCVVAFERGILPPSKWEAFADGFSAGVEYGRKTEPPCT